MAHLEICYDCKKESTDNAELFYCSACADYACINCWNSLPLHQPGTQSGKKHEQTELWKHRQISDIQRPRHTEFEQVELHEKTLSTKWFGVVEEFEVDSVEPQFEFHDYSRFKDVSNESKVDPKNQFPALVSFIGQTAAGKSTLINALMKVSSSWIDFVCLID